VLWAIATVVCGHLALSLVVAKWRPELRDPPYGHKLARLREQLAEQPGRPLALVLGSSRSLMGVRPDLLTDRHQPEEQQPLVFNFALAGSDPTHELLTIHRLLGEGVRPRWVLIEVPPPLLHDDRPVEERIVGGRLAGGDLGLVGRYATRPG